MLSKAKDLRNYQLGAKDGDLGRIKDFYFDDQTWTVRYLVVDTGTWLTDRKVLVSPYAVKSRDKTGRLLKVDLTKDQVRNSPPMDTHMPVSRQYEMEYYQYYNWPYYWQGPALWGPAPFPMYPLGNVPPAQQTPSMPQPTREPSLRSTQEVAGYRLLGRDGEFGHVEDFVIDDENWMIRYLVIDTRNWWPGKSVLLSPDWVTAVDWERSQVRIDIDRPTIENAPTYDDNTEITREFENRLFQYYRRAPYWQPRRMAA